MNKLICKTNIINTIEGDILEKYKLTILEDMIRNQYKRNHILIRYKKTVSTDRYRAYKPDEVIISHDSLIQASLMELYESAQQKYFSGIIPFDESSIDEDINIDKLTIESKHVCLVGKAERINILISKSSQELLNIQSITNIEKISDKNKYSVLYGNIFDMNTEIDSKKIDTKSLSRYKIEYTSIQKMLI